MDSRPTPPPPANAAALTAYARLERISEPWALNRTFTIAVVLILAMVFGSWAASGEFENLILAAVWFTAIWIIVFVQDQWWSPALIITALAFETTAFGFPMNGMQIGMLVLALTFPVKMAMKTLRKAEPEMDPGILYWLLLGYVCLHAVVILGYNKIEGVQLKNIVKAYFGAITPLVFYGLLIRYCQTRTVKPATIALFCATFIAVFFSIVTVFFGLDIQPFSDLRISIGWLSFQGAEYIIRNVTIGLFLGGIAFWPVLKAGWPRLILGFSIMMSAFGVLESGGRLSLATCIAGGFFFAFIRRRIWVALPVILITTVVSGAINIKPDILFVLPETVQRCLAPLNFSDKKTDIQEETAGSDDWHNTLRNESFPYWMADTGSFFVGHGFKAWDYSLSDYDDSGDINDFDRRKELAIEMGLCENMFSAITNIFGLTGLVLYGSFLINLAFRLWKAARLSPERSIARALCEFSFVSLVPSLVFCLFMGGTPGIELVYWALGLLAARPYIAGMKTAPAPSIEDRPAFARPAFEREPSMARAPRMRPGRA